MSFTVHCGDCRTIMPQHGPFDMIVADPPYGDTSLEWDRHVDGWEAVAASCLKPTGSMWVFGSMRFFMATADRFRAAGFRMAQDIVWEKQNGSGFAADRFKRVHEHAVQFYLANAAWGDVFNEVQRQKYSGPDKHVRRRLAHRGDHVGAIGQTGYIDDGTRIVRSVVHASNLQGKAIHPTEKPSPLLEILIRTSCPPGGLVGDFFAGSGAAGEACAISGRNYIGTEIDPEMAEKARARLSQNLFSRAAE
jgi:site-specific DNA-methyltransferase (adenine-specific)